MADMFPPYLGEYELMANTVLESARASSKPVGVVIQPATHPDTFKQTFLAQENFATAGFPVYSTVNSAANAISKFLDSSCTKRQWSLKRGATRPPLEYDTPCYSNR